MVEDGPGRLGGAEVGFADASPARAGRGGCRAAAGRRRGPRPAPARRPPARRRGPCSCARSVRRGWTTSTAFQAIPAARRAWVTPGRTARRASAASAWASSVSAAASHSSAVRREQPVRGIGRRSASAPAAPGRHDGSAARARSSSVSISRQRPSMKHRPQAHAAVGDRVEPVGQVGLAQRRAAPNGRLEAAPRAPRARPRAAPRRPRPRSAPGR